MFMRNPGMAKAVQELVRCYLEKYTQSHGNFQDSNAFVPIPKNLKHKTLQHHPIREIFSQYTKLLLHPFPVSILPGRKS